MQRDCVLLLPLNNTNHINHVVCVLCVPKGDALQSLSKGQPLSKQPTEQSQHLSIYVRVMSKIKAAQLQSVSTIDTVQQVAANDSQIRQVGPGIVILRLSNMWGEVILLQVHCMHTVLLSQVLLVCALFVLP